MCTNCLISCFWKNMLFLFSLSNANPVSMGLEVGSVIYIFFLLWEKKMFLYILKSQLKYVND